MSLTSTSLWRAPTTSHVGKVEEAPKRRRKISMRMEDIERQLQEEGLVLVPSAAVSGFKWVKAQGSHSATYKATAPGSEKNLGNFPTAAEAALAVARHLGPADSKRAAEDSVAAMAANAAAQCFPGMSMSEAQLLAAKEGLELLESQNRTGFLNVSLSLNEGRYNRRKTVVEAKQKAERGVAADDPVDPSTSPAIASPTTDDTIDPSTSPAIASPTTDDDNTKDDDLNDTANANVDTDANDDADAATGAVAADAAVGGSADIAAVDGSGSFTQSELARRLRPYQVTTMSKGLLSRSLGL